MCAVLKFTISPFEGTSNRGGQNYGLALSLYKKCECHLLHLKCVSRESFHFHGRLGSSIGQSLPPKSLLNGSLVKPTYCSRSQPEPFQLANERQRAWREDAQRSSDPQG